MFIVRVIEYTDIFPEEQNNLPDVRALISGINREHLVNLTSNMMSRLNGKEFYDADLDPTEGNVDFIRFFLSIANKPFIENIISRYRQLEDRSKESGYFGGFLATRPAAIMRFLRYCFSIPPCTDNWSNEMEVNFFKAMLLVNEEVNNAVSYFSNSNVPSDLLIAETILSYGYSNEGIEFKDMKDSTRRQLVRFVELVKFLQRKKRLKPIRELFRKQFHLSNLVEYAIPHIVMASLAGEKSVFYKIHKVNRLGKKMRYIIKKSSIRYDDILDFDKNIDYIFFRATPFIDMGNNCFALICTQFALEHIYESMYFQLKQYSLYSGFKNDDEFRQYITTEFTQNWMFNRFVSFCLTGRETFLALSEQDCRNKLNGKVKKGVEPPDYYIRDGNNIILFELKDTLASGKNKELRNAADFFDELKEKFFENAKGKPKAIKQLMNNVKAIQNGSFVFDDNTSKTSTIYPVLVVDSNYFTMRGIHVKLECWMRDYCENNGIDNNHVRQLILMDASTLRIYETLFKREGFVKLFEDYYNEITWKDGDNDSLFNSTKSFSEYMTKYPISNLDQVYNSVIRDIKKGLDSF